jgi:hypothetical protein
MKKDELSRLISHGEPTVVSIDPDIKTELSRRQIDKIITDIKMHLSKRKKVHLILVKE